MSQAALLAVGVAGVRRLVSSSSSYLPSTWSFTPAKLTFSKN